MKRRAIDLAICVCALTLGAMSAACGDDSTATRDSGTPRDTGTVGMDSPPPLNDASYDTTPPPPDVPELADVPLPPGEPIKIGFFYPGTGGLSAAGPGFLNAGRLAVQQINAEGGLLGGREVILVETDDETNPMTVQDKARTLLDTDHVVGIINPAGASTTLPVAMLCGKRHIPQVACCPGGGAFTTVQPVGDRYSYRLTTASTTTAAVVHQMAVDYAMCTRMAIIHSPALVDFANVLTARFTAGGGMVVATVPAMDGLASYSAQVATIAAATPDCVVVYQGPQSAATFINNWYEQPTPPVVQWMGVVPTDLPTFLATLSDPRRIDGMLGTWLIVPKDTIGFTAFATLYRAAYGAESVIEDYHARVYDSIMLLMLGIQRAGSIDGTAIRNSMVEISEPNAGGTDTVFRPDEIPAALDALRASMDIDYDGASGPVDLNECGSVLSVHERWRFTASLVGTPTSPYVPLGRVISEEMCTPAP